MTIEMQHTLAECGLAYLAFVLPVAIYCYIGKLLGERRRQGAFCAAVLTVWVALVFYRAWTWVIFANYYFAHNKRAELFDYDAPNHVAPYLLLGWVFPTTAILSFIGFSALWRRVTSRNAIKWLRLPSAKPD